MKVRMEQSNHKSQPQTLKPATWVYRHRPTWRAFVMAVLLLVGADLVARFWAARDMDQDDFSLPWRTSALAVEYARRLAVYKGPIVAMVGDSTLQPLPHMPQSPTLPYYVEQALRQVSGQPKFKVANLGLSGAHMGDLYNLVHLLPANVQNVVITLNYTFLGPLSRRPLTIYADLKRDDNETLQEAWSKAKAQGHRWPVNVFVEHLHHWVSDHWFLLHNGSWLAHKIFGDLPPNWLRRQIKIVGPWVRGENLEEYLREKRWSSAYIQIQRQVMKVDTMGLDNEATWLLLVLLNELQQRGVRTVVYATPFDWMNVERYQIANQANVKTNLEWLGRQIEQQGAIFLNLIDFGRPEWFFDIDHMIPSGRQAMAALLVEKVREQIYTQWRNP